MKKAYNEAYYQKNKAILQNYYKKKGKQVDMCQYIEKAPLPANKEVSKQYEKQSRLTSEGRARALMGSAKARAKKYGSTVTITKDWVREQIEYGFCQLTNLPFDLSSNGDGSVNPYSPSLDRIDSNNRNYTQENTRVVLTAVNLAINNFSLETALPILKALVNGR